MFKFSRRRKNEPILLENAKPAPHPNPSQEEEIASLRTSLVLGLIDVTNKSSELRQQLAADTLQLIVKGGTR